jgi:hypothetical protein
MYIGDYERHPALAAFFIGALSALTTYGILALYRDVRLFGWAWIWETLKNAFK